jgi:hypothetical protein
MIFKISIKQFSFPGINAGMIKLPGFEAAKRLQETKFALKDKESKLKVFEYKYRFFYLYQFQYFILFN